MVNGTKLLLTIYYLLLTTYNLQFTISIQTDYVYLNR